MISTDFLNDCTTGQQKRHSRKRLRAHSKQNTSKRRPLKRESHWICNANVNLDKTLRLRSKTTSDMLRATIPAQGDESMTRFKSSRWHTFRFPHWNRVRDTRGHIRTLENVKSTTSGHVRIPGTRKWNQRQKPAVCPSSLILSHAPMATSIRGSHYLSAPDWPPPSWRACARRNRRKRFVSLAAGKPTRVSPKGKHQPVQNAHNLNRPWVKPQIVPPVNIPIQPLK